MDDNQQIIATFLDNPLQKPFATKSSLKDSEKMLNMVRHRGMSDARSDSDEAHTPKLSGKMVEQRSTLKKQSR